MLTPDALLAKAPGLAAAKAARSAGESNVVFLVVTMVFSLMVVAGSRFS